MDGGDAVLVGELAHKTKPADTASETSSLPEQKGFRGFVLLDTQDFTGEPNFFLEKVLTGVPVICSRLIAIFSRFSLLSILLFIGEMPPFALSFQLFNQVCLIELLRVIGDFYLRCGF